MLAGRVVAASDVTAIRTTAQVQPPTVGRETLHTSRATRRYLWIHRARHVSTSCQVSPVCEHPRRLPSPGVPARSEPQYRFWTMPTVYEAAGGGDGMFRLATAWHERVMADEIVSHAFSHGFQADHTERLAAYWTEALGGPAAYTTAYGDETAVVRMHSGNGPHDEMDRRAIACFDQALQDVGLADDQVRQVLHDYFAWATQTTMSRYHGSEDDVPDGLMIPRWSSEGLTG